MHVDARRLREFVGHTWGEVLGGIVVGIGRLHEAGHTAVRGHRVETVRSDRCPVRGREASRIAAAAEDRATAQHRPGDDDEEQTTEHRIHFRFAVIGSAGDSSILLFRAWPRGMSVPGSGPRAPGQ